jgi:glutathione S-transferase
LALRRLGQTYDFVEAGNLFPPSSDYLCINPMGLIPTLEIGEEEPIFDSSDILLWIDERFSNVWPKEMESRWKDKRLSTLAEGLMAEAVAWRLESVRPDARTDTLTVRENNCLRVLSAIKNSAGFVQLLQRRKNLGGTQRGHRGDDLGGAFARVSHQGGADLAIALDYLEFRMGHLKWQKDHAEVEEVLLDFRDAEHFQDTDPRTKW